MTNLLSLEESLALTPERSNELFRNHVNRYLLQVFDILGFSKLDIKAAQGVEIWLKDGTKALDFSGGIGVVGIGHNHPRIIRAEQRCHEELLIDSIRMAPHKLHGALGYNLAKMLPKPLEVSYFAVSGSEAVESAMKLCERVQAPKKKFICINGSFHGKTHGALSVTTAHRFQDGFLLGIPKENVIPVPFGDAGAVSDAIAGSTLPGGNNDIIATILEPISGESARVPPAGYLKEVAQICRNNSVLTIFDEVKVGMGRSGRFCAFQHEDVVPDVVTVAKALGGSKRAIGAMITSHELFDKAYGSKKNATLHSCSFGGLGESCAVAIETLNVLHDEKLIEKAAEVGGYFGKRLETLQEKYPDQVREVLGRGLFRAVRFMFQEDLARRVIDTSKNPYFKTFQSVLMTATIRELFERHRVLSHFQPGAPDTLHFMPPLVVEKRHVDTVVDGLDDILARGISDATLQLLKKNMARLFSSS